MHFKKRRTPEYALRNLSFKSMFYYVYRDALTQFRNFGLCFNVNNKTKKDATTTITNATTLEQRRHRHRHQHQQEKQNWIKMTAIKLMIYFQFVSSCFRCEKRSGATVVVACRWHIIVVIKKRIDNDDKNEWLPNWILILLLHIRKPYDLHFMLIAGFLLII